MAIKFRTVRPIDPDVEEIITLSRAARDVPGGGVSPASFSRWMINGVRTDGSDERVKPATILIGGRRLTSVEAMRDFFAAQNATEESVPQFTPKQRAAQSQAARRKLEKLRI